METLPLFPLNTVLFPGTPLALHIFEPRYLKMIQACINHDAPFGIVLIRRGRESGGPLGETYNVGCKAKIMRVERLPGDRMNILAVGGKRFQVHAYNRDSEYLQGEVDTLPLGEKDPDFLVSEGDRLRPWIQNYVTLLSDSNLIQTNTYSLPEDPVDLAYTGAYMLQISARQKQSLLEVGESIRLLEAVRDYYVREISLARTLIDAPKPKPGVAGRLN